MKNIANDIVENFEDISFKQSSQYKLKLLIRAVKKNDVDFIERFFNISLDSPEKFKDERKNKYFSSLLWFDKDNKKFFNLITAAAFYKNYYLMKSFFSWAKIYKDDKDWSLLIKPVLKMSFQKNDIELLKRLREFFNENNDLVQNYLPYKSVFIDYLYYAKEDFEEVVYKKLFDEIKISYPVDVLNFCLNDKNEGDVLQKAEDFFFQNPLKREIDFDSELNKDFDGLVEEYSKNLKLKNYSAKDFLDKMAVDKNNKLPMNIKRAWPHYCFFHMLGYMNSEIKPDNGFKHQQNVSFLYNAYASAQNRKMNNSKGLEVLKDDLIEHHLNILLGEMFFKEKGLDKNLKHDKHVYSWQEKRFKNIIFGYEDYLKKYDFSIVTPLHLFEKIDKYFVLSDIIKKNLIESYDQQSMVANIVSNMRTGRSQNNIKEFIKENEINKQYQNNEVLYKDKRLPLSVLFELLNFKKFAKALKNSGDLKEKHEKFISEYPIILLHGYNVDMAERYVKEHAQDYPHINPIAHFFIYNKIFFLDEKNTVQLKDFIKQVYKICPENKDKLYTSSKITDENPASLNKLLSSDAGVNLNIIIEKEIIEEECVIKNKKNSSHIL